MAVASSVCPASSAASVLRAEGVCSLHPVQWRSCRNAGVSLKSSGALCSIHKRLLSSSSMRVVRERRRITSSAVQQSAETIIADGIATPSGNSGFRFPLCYLRLSVGIGLLETQLQLSY